MDVVRIRGFMEGMDGGYRWIRDGSIMRRARRRAEGGKVHGVLFLAFSNFYETISRSRMYSPPTRMKGVLPGWPYSMIEERSINKQITKSSNPSNQSMKV